MIAVAVSAPSPKTLRPNASITSDISTCLTLSVSEIRDLAVPTGTVGCRMSDITLAPVMQSRAHRAAVDAHDVRNNLFERLGRPHATS
ncbi:hypothetical protein ABIE89_000102 [Bradyrhizobium niftali]